MKKLLAAASIVAALSAGVTGAHAAMMMGPVSTGSAPGGGTGVAPVVVANTCNGVLPVAVGGAVPVQGGGSCAYTATCLVSGTPSACVGANAITSWAITAQSAANSFAIDATTGVLNGGSAAATLGVGAYTVTVTATNAAGPSAGVVQTVNMNVLPVVQVSACTVVPPVTNGVNVNAQGGGTCTYAAQCMGIACTGGSAVTGWSITAQSLANGFSITSGGVLQGGTAAASVGGGSSYTVTVAAINAVGPSPPVTQTVTTTGGAGAAPVVAAQNCTVSSGFTNGQTVNQTHGAGACAFAATCNGVPCGGGNAITSWAILSQSLTNAYSLSATGVLQGGTNSASVTTESDTITIVARNANGPSPAVTQTITAYADGSIGAQASGSVQTPTLLSAKGYVHPPWNVAAVDYPVGPYCPGGLTPWTSVTTAGTSIGGQNFNITGNNVTLNCIDFRTSNSAQIVISGSNATINNSYMIFSTTNAAAGNEGIVSISGSSPTLKYNDINGNGPALVAAGFSSCLVPASCQTTLIGQSGGGTFTFQYNYAYASNQHIIENIHNSTASTIVYDFNYIYNAGAAVSGPHLNYMQYGNNGNVITGTHNYNTTYLPIQPKAGGEGFQAAENNGNGTVTGTYNNNTMIGGPNGEGRLSIHTAQPPGNQVTVNQNYIFWGTGAPYLCDGSVSGSGPWLCSDSNGGRVTYSNNINLTNGAAIGAP